MKVRNLRTGVVGEVDDSLAHALIKLGRLEEFKESPVKTESVEDEKPIAKFKQSYKTKDMKHKD